MLAYLALFTASWSPGTTTPRLHDVPRAGVPASMGGRRALARARGRRRERAEVVTPEEEKLAMGVATAPRPLAPTPRLRGRPRVRSVELTRRNHATVLFSDGSHREVHTPSLDQRTDEAEWLAVRAALEITASEFAAAKDEWRHASRDLLLRRKLGDPAAQFRGNAATAFGTRMEPRAVRMYERVTGHAVEPTGLHMHDNLRWGASPDGIVTTAANETGLLEVKCSFRHRRRGAVPQLQDCPAEFFAQIQGQLAVTGHDWCDLFYYTPPGKPSSSSYGGGGRHWSLVRVPRDDDYFAALAPSLEFGSVLREEEILRR
mmetsp:Transcript_42188/g.136026  ORF Transcript_42188/g.136026 Transcript_42188/m.136026 type:complete len:317 (+) Transcript_42188:101-1051(+)